MTRLRNWQSWLGPIADLPVPTGLTADKRAAVILWSSAPLLVLLVFQSGDNTLRGRLWWAFWGAVVYLIVPLALILFVFRESPARYGLRLHVTRRTLAIYTALLVAMAAPLYWASHKPEFIARYPLVSDLGADSARIWLWQVVRAARFVCLEFFFRGYLVLGLEARFGLHSIAVSTIPYSLMHVGKPLPEALGAVVAGLVLGLLAQRSRSIAAGAALHIVIATAMDLIALYRRGII